MAADPFTVWPDKAGSVTTARAASCAAGVDSGARQLGATGDDLAEVSVWPAQAQEGRHSAATV